MANYLSDRTGASIDTVLDDADTGNIGKEAVAITSSIADLMTGFYKATNAAPQTPNAGNNFVMVNSRSATNKSFFAHRDLTNTVNVGFTSDGVNITWEELYTSGNAASLPLLTAFAPADDNLRTLGDASGRWSEIFAGNGTINTSDAREKTAVSALTTDELNASKQLAKEVGTYKFLSAVASKGEAARTHTGLTVQRAIEIMEQNNLEALRYAFICYDSWTEVKELILYEDGKSTGQYKIIKKAGDRYGFRYDQLNQFILAGISARLDAAGL